MKKSYLWIILLLGSVVFSTASAFNSLYVFGDGVCTTTNNGFPGKQYYGKRYTNGRIWLEVLAQRQGIGISNNWSYFGQDSASLVANVSSFKAPADATNDLFVAWASDADFVGFLGQFNPPYLTANIPQWNNAINLSLTNHFKAITNLYAKGVRTLIMPNAVDISEIPYFNHLATASKSFVRARVNYFNTNFATTVNRARAACPDLTVYVPDVFSLLDNVLTNAAFYGLTNALDFSGQPVDAYTYFTTNNIVYATTNNGMGANFIFWDSFDPTAKMHAVLADTVQQIISPVQFASLGQSNGSNRLDVVNVPVGLNGFVEATTNLLLGWTNAASFISISPTQSIYLPPLTSPSAAQVSPKGVFPPGDSTGLAFFPPQLYRLRFPYAWNWP